MDEAGDPRKRFHMLVAPYSHVPRRDPSRGGDGRRLHHDESDSADRPASEMDEVPVVRQTVNRTVLAHRRHRDPIAKRDVPDRQRTEHVDLRYFAIVVYA